MGHRGGGARREARVPPRCLGGRPAGRRPIAFFVVALCFTSSPTRNPSALVSRRRGGVICVAAALLFLLLFLLRRPAGEAEVAILAGAAAPAAAAAAGAAMARLVRLEREPPLPRDGGGGGPDGDEDARRGPLRIGPGRRLGAEGRQELQEGRLQGRGFFSPGRRPGGLPHGLPLPFPVPARVPPSSFFSASFPVVCAFEVEPGRGGGGVGLDEPQELREGRRLRRQEARFFFLF